MKILIATGLSRSDIGGPFQYAHNLERELKALGNKVRVVKYGSVERSILSIWRHVVWADSVLALDSFSVGFPATLFAKIFRKKIIIRVGGDFLWSAYVNRTGEPLTLAEFYKNIPKLNAKEKIIFGLSKWTIRNARFLAFNTGWQKNIWESFYSIKESEVIRNFIPKKTESHAPKNKNFLWAGRLIPEKNPKMMDKLGVDVITGESHDKILEKTKDSYAVVSLAFTDICPNFILEGLSFEKPFIMTRETGLKELFPKGGIFVDPTNEQEIKKAMQELSDENTYNKYIEEIRSAYKERPWKELAEDFLNIWKRI